VLILVAGLALRLWGIADRLPSRDVADNPFDDTAVDEGDRRAMQYAWDMWGGGTLRLNLDPGTGDWPGLPFYLTLGSQMSYRIYDLARGGGSAESFRARAEERPAGIFLAARLESVLLGVLSIYLVFLLGLALAGRIPGLLAAAFVAVMPAHVFISQRIFDTNLLSLLFVTAASAAMIRLMRTGALRDSIVAGALVGLAAASKYMPAVLVVPLALAHVTKRPAKPGSMVRWRELGASLGALALAFAVTSPFTFLDPKKLVDMREQSERLRAEWAGLSSPLGTAGTYLLRTLPEMLTWPGYLLALFGCVLLWRRGRDGRIVLLGAVLLAVSVGTLGLAQPRFIVPIAGVLAVAAAMAVTWVDGRVRARTQVNFVPAVAAAAVVAWGLVQAVSIRSQLSRPDSRHVAHAWVVRSIGTRVPMAYDNYGPVLAQGPTERCATLWPFHTWQTDYVASAFHPEWLDGLRYYVISSEVTRRYEGADPRYETQRRFYGWIRSNARKSWSSDPKTTFGPGIDVYELPPGISSPQVRDSVWAREPRLHTSGGDISRWIAELAQNFFVAGDLEHAEEWARRGLATGSGSHGQELFETLAGTLLQQGRVREAEVVAAEGIARYPSSSLQHALRGMALEALGRPGEALPEYRAALALTKKEDARQFLEGEIARLEGH
jgi:hypothetical protein